MIQPSLATVPLLRVTNLKKHFPVHRGLLSRVVSQVFAVDGVSFDIARGERSEERRVGKEC